MRTPETIAVYWEEEIKVYSISLKKDLCMATLSFPTQRLWKVNTSIAEMEALPSRFEFTASVATSNDQTLLTLIFSLTARQACSDVLELLRTIEPDSQCEEVEMIYLYGPHFQDRYGIAEAAFQALQNHGTSVILSGCAGTSMYLLLPSGSGESAKEILCSTFTVPGSSPE